MPQLLSLTEPVRVVVSFALTSLHAYQKADAPVVLAVLTLDLAFVSCLVLLTWSKEWHRPATCVLATYNWLTVVQRGGQIASQAYLWESGGAPVTYEEWAALTWTAIDLLYSLLACISRTMWLVVTGWMEPPHHLDRFACSNHAARMTNCDLRKQHVMWQCSQEDTPVKYVADRDGRLEQSTRPFIPEKRKESPV